MKNPKVGREIRKSKKYNWADHDWVWTCLNEGVYSLVCENPVENDEGIDYTDWPSDWAVSEKYGQRVRFSSPGDSNEGVESIYESGFPRL